jgi:DegV family protein with EDD domain
VGKKIGFVTDSTADIPNDIIQRYAIQVIPAIITMGEQTYTDGIQISREDFYTRLPDLNPLPQTSAPSAGSFQEVYERLLSRGMDTVISIHPPPTLSGIYNAAWLAAREFGGRVHVLDGGQISLGLGFQVILAVEAARRTCWLTWKDCVNAFGSRLSWIPSSMFAAADVYLGRWLR